MTSGADSWLVDEHWFKAYPLTDDTTIGRGPDSTIIVRDPAVSRTHAEVKRDADGYYVLSSHGSSGTKLNGEPLAAHRRLQEGDVIEIAFSSLRFTTHAPTGEMFVVPRDTATSSDRHEVPTRATLHAMHPITLVSRWRRHWRLAVGLLLLLALLLFIWA